MTITDIFIIRDSNPGGGKIGTQISDYQIFQALVKYSCKYTDEYCKTNGPVKTSRAQIIDILIGYDACRSRTTAGNVYTRLKTQKFIQPIWGSINVDGIDVLAIRSAFRKLNPYNTSVLFPTASEEGVVNELL